MPNKICDRCLQEYTGPNENRTLLDLEGITCPHYKPEDEWDAMKDPNLIAFMEWEP